jgi:mitogen-activated protein kinase kinase
MDGGSLDKVYAGGVDEPCLAAITDSVVRGLMFLKEEHNIIHRDVKPTNILINTEGKVKLCDFGVSGNLVASKASTVIGCQSYMAPERIHNPDSGNVTYTANSDIWSLGVSILEIAQGSYPYPPEAYNNVFAQLRAIVSGDPPQLAERFSPEARDFVAQCLQKKPYQRPTYQQLLEHPWLKKYRGVDVGMADFVKKALERGKNATSTSNETTPTGTTIPVSRNNPGLVSRDGRNNMVPALHHSFLNNRQ